MGYALVSAGPVSASMSPSFGQPTAAGNLLVCWIACNSSGDTNPITCDDPTWTVRTPEFGAAFVWSAIAFKANCSAGETAPTFQPSGVSSAFTKLAEFSGGAAASPLDQSGNGGASGGSNQVATCSAPDGQAGNLILYSSYWNGSNSGFTISNTMADGAGNSLTPTAYDNSGTGTGTYYSFMWGIAEGTGSDGDTAEAELSGFENGSCGIVSFKPAGGGGGTAHTATASLMVTPSITAARARGRFRTAALAVSPSFTATRTRGRNRSASLLVTPSFTAARTHGHGRTARLLVVPAFSAARAAAHVRTGSLLVTPVFRAVPIGGAVPVTQPGSWWGLDTVFKQSREEFLAYVSRPPVACPVDGEPLRNAPATPSASGVELYCKYCGWQYPRDWVPPQRPWP